MGIDVKPILPKIVENIPGGKQHLTLRPVCDWASSSLIDLICTHNSDGIIHCKVYLWASQNSAFFLWIHFINLSANFPSSRVFSWLCKYFCTDFSLHTVLKHYVLSFFLFRFGHRPWSFTAAVLMIFFSDKSDIFVMYLLH